MNITPVCTRRFQKNVLNWYVAHGRHELPWRTTTDPYRICVAEIMLQQTQVDRVIPKYCQFLIKFPTVYKLAQSTPGAVVRMWQGLGYNRRALHLHALARCVVTYYHGVFPDTAAQLETLPGIGPYTARAILVFAYNRPEIVLETNIRRVFLHFFFPNEQSVHDDRLLPYIQKTLVVGDPRLWYSALMDYGALELRRIPNANHRSRHYTRQPRFSGSIRQIRGAVLRLLHSQQPRTFQNLSLHIQDVRLRGVLESLVQEGFITRKGRCITLVL